VPDRIGSPEYDAASIIAVGVARTNPSPIQRCSGRVVACAVMVVDSPAARCTEWNPTSARPGGWPGMWFAWHRAAQHGGPVTGIGEFASCPRVMSSGGRRCEPPLRLLRSTVRGSPSPVATPCECAGHPSRCTTRLRRGRGRHRNRRDHLAKGGFDIERTPEDWLFKACTDDVVVGVLHRLNGVPVDSARLDSADEHDGWRFGCRCCP
jgi:hypothetical protein